MKTLKKYLPIYGMVVAFVFLFVLSAIRNPQFLQAENLRNLFSQNAAVGMMAVGMTFVIITAGIDLSVASLATLAASLGIMAMNKAIGGGQSEQNGVLIGFFSSIGVGVLFGFVNGLLISYGRVVPFVTTLVGLIGFRSLAQYYADGGEVRSNSANLFQNMGMEGLPIPFLKNQFGPVIATWPMIAWILLSIIGSIILNKTAYGRYAIAVGANERAARYAGIPIKRVKLITYTLVGFCAGLAGILETAKLNSISTGSSFATKELDVIAAVVIGGTSLRGGYGRLWGTFVGVLLLGMINNIMVFESISIHIQGVVKGVIILVAVLLQRPASEE